MTLGKNFSNLKVILVEPNGPLNVGSVARLCSNFEVDELRIVSPKCDIFSLEAKKMALKGQKFLEHCKIFDDLQKAIFDCDLVLASCGRIDVKKDSLFISSEDSKNESLLTSILPQDARTKSQSKIAFLRLLKILQCSRNF